MQCHRREALSLARVPAVKEWDKEMGCRGDYWTGMGLSSCSSSSSVAAAASGLAHAHVYGARASVAVPGLWREGSVARVSAAAAREQRSQGIGDEMKGIE